jgi:tetratricopeptide (TPR) repeat protein/transcriptional regulator with XRE-family HTH domain
MASAQPLSFARLLLRYRLAANLTQEQLAHRAQLSARGISDLERGVKARPHAYTVAALAKALGLSEAERAAFETAARGSRTPAPLPAPPARPRLPRATNGLSVIGRERELAALDASLAGAGPPLLLLAGEPGIGKTRLMQEALARARAGGWTALAGGCTRRSGQEPYSPLLETLASFVRGRTAAQLRVDLEGCAWLVRLLPELAERAIAPAPAWTLTPEQERRLMFDAVARFLANVASASGTLLVLDDLQWASPDTLHLLAALLGSQSASDGQAPALRILGAYRGSEVPAHAPLSLLLAELEPQRLAARLELGPLEPAAAAELLDLLLTRAEGRADSGSETRERLLRRAEGVPFFLVSYAQALRSGALDASPADAGEPNPDAVPWDVAQSIRLRVAALPGPARTLLGVAAVAGRAISRADLFAIAGQVGNDLATDEALLVALEAAASARLLVETGDDAYAFAHDLIREVTLADLSAARRETWHRRVGEALERLPPPARRVRVAELAWHFLRGADSARALPYTLEAGDQAADLYAHVEADRHFRVALALARELGVPQPEAEALEKRGEILRLLEREEEAAVVFAQAIEAYGKIGDTEAVWRASGRLAGVFGILGTPEKGLALLEPLIVSTSGATPSSALASMYLEYSWLTWLADDLNTRLEAAAQTARIAAAIGDSRIQGEAEFQRGNTLVLMGSIQEGLQYLLRAVPLLETANHLRRLGSTLSVIANIYKMRGVFQSAQAYNDRALEVALRVGVRSQLRYMWANHADIAFLLGDWGTAAADLDHAMILSDQESDKLETAPAFSALGLLRICTGNVGDGIRLLERAIAHAEARGVTVLDTSLPAHAALAEFDLVMDRAQAAYDRLMPLFASTELENANMTLTKPLLAWATLAIGESERARTLLSEAVSEATDQFNDLAHEFIYRVRAQVELSAGDWRAAENALVQALTVTRAAPYPYAEAKALFIYGQLNLAQGAVAAARERLTQALAILNRLGERLYAARVERLLADLDQSASSGA